MRLGAGGMLLPIAALAGLLAWQRPDWVRDLRQEALHLGAAAPATVAERAGGVAPDRDAVLPGLARAADAGAAVGAAKDPDARGRLQELLRHAAGAMAGSEAMGELRAVREAQARLAAARDQAAAARLAGGDTAAAEAQAAEAARELERRTDAFVAKLGSVGVPVSREAAAGLAGSVNGDDVVALLGASASVARIEGELRGAVAEGGGNEALLRRYYQLHATLLAVLDTVQTEVMGRIDTLFLPRLNEVNLQARELRADAGAQLATVRDAGLRAALEANMRTDELTLQATELYRRYLGEQRAGLAAALDRTRAARGVAENTARTAVLALDMASMVRDGDRDMGAVLALRLPMPPVPFTGEALRREFEGLSRRLGQPAS